MSGNMPFGSDPCLVLRTTLDDTIATIASPAFPHQVLYTLELLIASEDHSIYT